MRPGSTASILRPSTRHRTTATCPTTGWPTSSEPGSVLDLADHFAVGDTRADLGLQSGHGAGLVGLERLLHLHRLEHDDHVALLDRGALLDGDLDDRALHGRGDRVAGRGGPGFLAGSPLGLLRAAGATDRGQPAGKDDLEPASA